MLRHRWFSYTTGLPLLGMVSLFVWFTPAWSLHPSTVSTW
jgi:hypothetical protein